MSPQAARTQLLVVFVAALAIGCSQESVSVESLAPAPVPLATGAIVVPGNAAWVDSGIDVLEGQALAIHAEGVVRHRKTPLLGEHPPLEVGPEGTFLYDDEDAFQTFPLPAAASGPAPCYGLIGRVGQGPPFPIGRRYHGVPLGKGRLFLRVNDFDPEDNRGQFLVRVRPQPSPEPLGFRYHLTGQEPPGTPIPNARVVVFYVDGLRPDVVQEMSAMGHLPNISRVFLKGGVWCRQSFTGFPSDTITSNGTMWTGCLSDRHGVKGQVRFSRRTLQSESYLETLGPHRSSSTLSPQPIDRAVTNAKATSLNLLRGDGEGTKYRKSRVTDVPPVYAYLREDGTDWATSVLPMMTETPPLLWTRSMTRYLPYFQSQKAWQYIDDANTHFALKRLLHRDRPVTIIWLPETDSVSHKQQRGQFGSTRRTIARADVLIGQVIEELRETGELDHTYLMLVSDHGHHGGRFKHLAHYDLAHRVFFDPRQRGPNGEWVDGGLGLSVRQHRSWSRHPEHSSRSFVYLDANSAGAARVFLPKQHFQSDEWEGGANRPGSLLSYRIDPSLPPVNLVEFLLAQEAEHPTAGSGPPIDLVLIKLNVSSVLISTRDRGSAIVERTRGGDGRWRYRYSVVSHVRPAADGGVNLQVVADPVIDPFGILEVVDPEFLSQQHDERIWLDITAQTEYPDSVVAITRHLLWQDHLYDRELEYAPDLVVTARPGWYFGPKASPGTMHGFPLRDAMRASWFIAGPNIRRGAVLDRPCRLADLTPTILEMAGHPTRPEQTDGEPLRCIYQCGVQSEVRPVYWGDVDLQAWASLEYQPHTPYPLLPKSVNQPERWLDLNNIAANAITVNDLSVTRLADSVVFPFSKGNGPLIRGVEAWETKARRSSLAWLSEGTRVLDVPGIALGDATYTSLGNLQRMNAVIDWVQNRDLELQQKMLAPVGASELPLTPYIHGGVDGLQHGFWSLYAFGQRAVVQILDETILNGIEDHADWSINRHRKIPADVPLIPVQD